MKVLRMNTLTFRGAILSVLSFVSDLFLRVNPFSSVIFMLPVKIFRISSKRRHKTQVRLCVAKSGKILFQLCNVHPYKHYADNVPHPLGINLCPLVVTCNLKYPSLKKKNIANYALQTFVQNSTLDTFV